MMAVTREQFSVPHGHKIITQFINKIINVNGGKARKPSSLQNKSHKHLRVLQNNISFVVAGDFGRHRCASQVYPGTCKNTCVLVYFSESLHIFAITEYWQVMYECRLNARTIYFTIWQLTLKLTLRYYCIRLERCSCLQSYMIGRLLLSSVKYRTVAGSVGFNGHGRA